MKSKAANPLSIIKRESVNSSTIKSLGYDKKNQTLEVEFHVRKGKNKVIWRYHPISSLAFKQLMGAKSVGSHFATYIKSNPLINQQNICK